LRYLMCPPHHYRLEYAINPWMKPGFTAIDGKLAQEQWSRLRHVMESLADIAVIEPDPAYPDMVFCANGAFALANNVLISRFRHGERRGEEALIRRWFDYRGYTVHELPDGVCFEGTGDAILDRSGGWIWAGYGFRSDRAAHETIARGFDADVVSLHLVDERFYHLDTCLAPLSGGYVMYYPGAFDAESLHLIEQRVPSERRVVLAESDATEFSCNIANVGRVIVAHRMSRALQARLEALGFAVAVAPVSEFVKSGGAVFCMMLRLEDEPVVQLSRV